MNINNDYRGNEESASRGNSRQPDRVLGLEGWRGIRVANLIILGREAMIELNDGVNNVMLSVTFADLDEMESRCQQLEVWMAVGSRLRVSVDETGIHMAEEAIFEEGSSQTEGIGS